MSTEELEHERKVQIYDPLPLSCLGMTYLGHRVTEDLGGIAHITRIGNCEMKGRIWPLTLLYTFALPNRDGTGFLRMAFLQGIAPPHEGQERPKTELSPVQFCGNIVSFTKDAAPVAEQTQKDTQKRMEYLIRCVNPETFEDDGERHEISELIDRLTAGAFDQLASKELELQGRPRTGGESLPDVRAPKETAGPAAREENGENNP